MSNQESLMVIAGLHGPVTATALEIIAQPEVPLRLEAVAAARTEHVGRRLGQVLANTPAALADVPVISLEDAVHNTDSQVVLSALRNEEAIEYEHQLAEGRVVASNAGVHRMDPNVALFNAYVKSPQLEELFWPDRSGYIIAGGNCTTNHLVVALAPLDEAIGVKRVETKTRQGWSGSGIDYVPPEHAGQVIDIDGDEKTKIETEPNKFLGSMHKPAGIDIDATPRRGPWVDGHYQRIRVELARETTAEEIDEIWRSFKSPRLLHGLPGRSMPARSPIEVSYGESLLDYDGPVPMLGVQHPMRIRARVLGVDPQNARIFDGEISGHNLGLGAAGVNIMNILYARAKGYLD